MLSGTILGLKIRSLISSTIILVPKNFGKSTYATTPITNPTGYQSVAIIDELRCNMKKATDVLHQTALMLQSYFRIALRHLGKNKGFAFINIIGLASGMAIALLIGLWISDEIGFDHYSPNHSRIAVGMITQHAPGQRTYTGDIIATVMGGAFRTQYRDLFSRTALTHNGGDGILIANGTRIVTGDALWVQKELPDIFGFHILKGSTSGLKDPSTALISRSLAKSLFGDADPIGQSIKTYNQLDFRIGGVYDDLPRNTTFYHTALLLPWYNKANDYRVLNTDWDDHDSRLYVELAPHITAEAATLRIQDAPTAHIKEDQETALVYPLDKVHLYDHFTEGVPDGGGIRFVWLFGIIGVFVLLLACINFMNLSTARSEHRAKEVGIRKTIGSRSRQLVAQFLSESVLVAVLAFVISIALVALALPFFNSLSDKDMRIPWASPLFWMAALAFVFLTGLLAGSYPAFYLSRFRPVKVLKGSFRAGRYASLPRRILVVLQFTVSLSLIIGTIIVFRQVIFIKDRPVGYSRDGLLTISMNTPDIYQHYEALRTELIQSRLAENVAASDLTPTGFWNGNALDWRGKHREQDAIMFRNVDVTPDFGATIGWHIVKGRDFSRAFPTDSNAMILNVTAAKTIGIPNPIGETMRFDNHNYTVIGVAADMLTNNPYDTIQPAIFLGGRWVGNIIVRIEPGLSTQKALAAMEPIFKKYNPASPFTYRFIDEEYAAKFDAEQRIGHLAAVFTALAIFISCLGLFGLAAFVAEQRTKEIGIRKILGAGVINLWGLLSADFLRLTALSICIAMPLTWWAMHQWLENYAYHAALSWWIFASAGAGILVITLATVSFQSLRAAFMNPVRSLRSE